jgi:SnoaL-like polyketide cyclase
MTVTGQLVRAAEVDDFLAPGFVNHTARPGTPDGPEGAREAFTRLRTGSSEMHFDLQTMIAEEDEAVCIGIISGAHDRPSKASPRRTGPPQRVTPTS